MPDEASQVAVGVSVGAFGWLGVGVSVGTEGSVSVGVSANVPASVSEGVPAKLGVLVGGLLPLHWFAAAVAVGKASALCGSFTLKASANCACAAQASPEAIFCSAIWMVASAQRLEALIQDESDMFG